MMVWQPLAGAPSPAFGKENAAQAGSKNLEENLGLAQSYAAKSTVHVKWVVFFEHELMRQAARAERTGADARDKFAALYNARREAMRLAAAARVLEQRRRDELRRLRARCARLSAPRASKRLKPARDLAGAAALKAASVSDPRVFERILSFV